MTGIVTCQVHIVPEDGQELPIENKESKYPFFLIPHSVFSTYVESREGEPESLLKGGDRHEASDWTVSKATRRENDWLKTARKETSIGTLEHRMETSVENLHITAKQIIAVPMQKSQVCP